MLSYRKLAMRVLGRPLHTGGSDSPRPASQRAAAFILTAAMLITLAAPAFAKEWYIEDGNITVKAGDTKGTNKVSQGESTDVPDTDTVITNREKNASSHTVTIDAGKDKVEVTLKDVNIKADSGSALTSNGDVTLTLKGDNHLTGGSGDTYGGDGITSSGSLTISGGTVTATGGNSTDSVGSGGSGIYSVSGDVAISGGTVTANGGSGKDGYGGNGISSSNGVAISGGTVTANGGSGNSSGGNGISSTSTTISGGTVTANGGSGNSSGGNGIRSFDVAISGGTVKAAGGNGKNGNGGNGIIGSGRVAISGGTVNAAGGDGGNGKDGGYGIISNDIDLSGSLELTAKAGSPNGKALSRAGHELDLDDIKEKLDPGAKVTTTDADGKVIKQVSIPRPVEPEKPVIPEESSSSSDGGSSAPSAPVSPLPGLTVTDKDGQRISYTSTQSGNTLTVCVGRFTASFRISLAALRQLRAEGIETIAFQTILCSTTLSVDELLAMGSEDAEAVLTHRFTDSSLTVG